MPRIPLQMIGLVLLTSVESSIVRFYAFTYSTIQTILLILLTGALILVLRR